MKMDKQKQRKERHSSKDGSDENNQINFNTQVGSIVSKLEQLEECQPGPRLQLFSQPKKPDVRKSLIQTYLKEKPNVRITSTPCPPKNRKTKQDVDSPLDLSPIRLSNCSVIAEEIDVNEDKGSSDCDKRSNDVIEISDDSSNGAASNSPDLDIKQEKLSRGNFYENDKVESFKKASNSVSERSLRKLQSISRSKLTENNQSNCTSTNRERNQIIGNNKVDSGTGTPSTFDSHDKSQKPGHNHLRTSRTNNKSENPQGSISNKENKCHDYSEISSPKTCNIITTGKKVKPNGVLTEINDESQEKISDLQMCQHSVTSNENNSSPVKSRVQKHVGTSPPSFNKTLDRDRVIINDFINKLTPFFKNQQNAVCRSIQTSARNSVVKEANIESAGSIVDTVKAASLNNSNKNKSLMFNNVTQATQIKSNNVTQKSIINNSADLLQLKSQAHSSKLLRTSKRLQLDELDEESRTESSDSSSLHKCEIDHYALFETLKNYPRSYWETRNELFETNAGSGRWRVSGSLAPIVPRDVDNTLIASDNEDIINDGYNDHTLTPKQRHSKNKISLSTKKQQTPVKQILTESCKDDNKDNSSPPPQESDQIESNEDCSHEISPKRIKQTETPTKIKRMVHKTDKQDKCTPPRTTSLHSVEPQSIVVSRKKAKLIKNHKKSSLVLVSPSNSFLAANYNQSGNENEENNHFDTSNSANSNERQLESVDDKAYDFRKVYQKSIAKDADHEPLNTVSTEMNKPLNIENKPCPPQKDDKSKEKSNNLKVQTKRSEVSSALNETEENNRENLGSSMSQEKNLSIVRADSPHLEQTEERDLKVENKCGRPKKSNRKPQNNKRGLKALLKEPEPVEDTNIEDPLLGRIDTSKKSFMINPAPIKRSIAAGKSETRKCDSRRTSGGNRKKSLMVNQASDKSVAKKRNKTKASAAKHNVIDNAASNTAVATNKGHETDVEFEVLNEIEEPLPSNNQQNGENISYASDNSESRILSDLQADAKVCNRADTDILLTKSTQILSQNKVMQLDINRGSDGNRNKTDARSNNIEFTVMDTLTMDQRFDEKDSGKYSVSQVWIDAKVGKSEDISRRDTQEARGTIFDQRQINILTNSRKTSLMMNLVPEKPSLEDDKSVKRKGKTRKTNSAEHNIPNTVSNTAVNTNEEHEQNVEFENHDRIMEEPTSNNQQNEENVSQASNNCESRILSDLQADPLSPVKSSQILPLDNNFRTSTILTKKKAMPIQLNFNRESDGNRNKTEAHSNNIEFTVMDTLTMDQRFDEKDSGKYSMSQVWTDTNVCKPKRITGRDTQEASATIMNKCQTSFLTFLEFMKPHLSDQFSRSGVMCLDPANFPGSMYCMQYIEIAPQKMYWSNSSRWREYLVLEGTALVEKQGNRRQLKCFETIKLQPGDECSITNNGTENLLLFCHTV